VTLLVAAVIAAILLEEAWIVLVAVAAVVLVGVAVAAFINGDWSA
jgi:hypothetical protein